MGLFGDYAGDIADAPDDPFGLRDGHYHGAIIKVQFKEGKKKDSDKEWKAIIVTLSAEGQSGTHDHFLSLPLDTDDARTREIKLSAIKKFLTGCEIPRSRMNNVNAEDLENLEVDYKLSTSKNGFRNLDIQLAKGSGISVSDSDLDIFDNKSHPGNPAVAAVTDAEFGL